MLNVPNLSDEFIFGGNFEGGTAAGNVDMSAATTGEYTFGEGGRWHQRMSVHAYSWLIIVAALTLLWLMGGVVFGDVNV